MSSSEKFKPPSFHGNPLPRSPPDKRRTGVSRGFGFTVGSLVDFVKSLAPTARQGGCYGTRRLDVERYVRRASVPYGYTFHADKGVVFEHGKVEPGLFVTTRPGYFRFVELDGLLLTDPAFVYGNAGGHSQVFSVNVPDSCGDVTSFYQCPACDLLVDVMGHGDECTGLEEEDVPTHVPPVVGGELEGGSRTRVFQHVTTRKGGYVEYVMIIRDRDSQVLERLTPRTGRVSTCQSGSRSAVPSAVTKVWCDECSCMVNPTGHAARCKPKHADLPRADRVYAAWLGDAQHLFDVRFAAFNSGVVLAKRQLFVEAYCSGPAQAAYVKGVSERAPETLAYGIGPGTDKYCASLFEASYHGEFRKSYLAWNFSAAVASALVDGEVGPQSLGSLS